MKRSNRGPGRERVFLDANVLFSAAWREDSGLRALWKLPGVELLSSTYALEEARINLPDPERLARLHELAAALTREDSLPARLPPEGEGLPPKDRPILQAALAARADYLLTGDLKHFGALLGRAVGGLTILTPVEYLRRRRK